MTDEERDLLERYNRNEITDEELTEALSRIAPVPTTPPVLSEDEDDYNSYEEEEEYEEYSSYSSYC